MGAGGQPGHPILIAAALRPAFATLSGEDGGRHILAAVATQVVGVPLPGSHATRDLDTPEDWDRLARRNRALGAPVSSPARGGPRQLQPARPAG